MEEFDRPPPVELPAPTLKGRGAAGNVDHCFSTERRQAEDDGWWHEEAADPRTRLHVDTAKTVISHNDSPDLPFDQSLNPYRGCEHGCIYCYARPTHAWLGLSPGLDFETQIFHKPDAPRRLQEALAAPDYRCRPIALGTATDAYQPAERRLGLTRAILQVMLERRHPVTVVTKSALICRDLDLWSELARRNLAQVAISLTSLNADLARQLEPRASAPPARLEAIRRLADEPKTNRRTLASLNELLGANYALASDLASMPVLMKTRGAELDPVRADAQIETARNRVAELLTSGSIPDSEPAPVRESLSGLKENFAMIVLARRLAHIEYTARKVARLAARPVIADEEEHAH